MTFGDVNRVNTNVQALTSQFSLNKINARRADAQLKLSTGLRINRAEDDAAGFSIASKLSSKVTGLEQAQRNIGDAKSMLDVAESGLNTIMDTLVEIKGKATQAGTESIGQEERDFIGDQIEALASEINNVVDDTTFSGTTLLGTANAADDARVNTDVTFQVGEKSSDNQAVSIASAAVADLFGAALDVNGNGGITTAQGIGNSKGTLAITNGTSSADFRTFIDNVDSAVQTVAGTFNQIGIDQNSLSIKQENLSQSISSNSAARSRIQDADFAKVQSESIKLQILQQTATSALAQANSSPQAVLGFLGG